MAVIDAIHAVELKYGSLSKAPDDAPELIALHAVVKDYEKSIGPTTQLGKTVAKNRVKKLYEQGFFISKIVSITGLTEPVVIGYLNSFGLPYKGLNARDRVKLYFGSHYVGTGTIKSLAGQIGLSFGQLAAKIDNQNSSYHITKEI